MPGWLFGVALAGTAGIINAGGVIIQKRAHIANSKLPVEEQTSYVTNKWWLLGFAVYVVGNFSNALALTFASQSIVTPLNSVNLVANTLMAPFFLGETLTRIDVIATLLIICGCTITVLFGSHADKVFSLDALIANASRIEFVAYASTVAVVLLIGYVVGKIILGETLEASKNADAKPSLASPLVAVEQVLLPNEDSCLAQFVQSIPAASRVRFLTVQFACLGGALSSVNILMTKCLGELISESTTSGVNQFSHPLAYVFIGILVFSNVSEVYWMQKALQLFDALIVVPMFSVTVSVLSIVTGAVFFNEIAEFQMKQIILFPLGVLITLCGVYLLSQREVDEAVAVIARKRVKRRRPLQRNNNIDESNSLNTSAIEERGRTITVWRDTGHGYEFVCESVESDAVVLSVDATTDKEVSGSAALSTTCTDTPMKWKRRKRSVAVPDAAWWEWEEIGEQEVVDTGMFDIMEAESEEVWIEDENDAEYEPPPVILENEMQGALAMTSTHTPSDQLLSLNITIPEIVIPDVPVPAPIVHKKRRSVLVTSSRNTSPILTSAAPSQLTSPTAASALPNLPSLSSGMSELHRKLQHRASVNSTSSPTAASHRASSVFESPLQQPMPTTPMLDQSLNSSMTSALLSPTSIFSPDGHEFPEHAKSRHEQRRFSVVRMPKRHSLLPGSSMVSIPESDQTPLAPVYEPLGEDVADPLSNAESTAFGAQSLASAALTSVFEHRSKLGVVDDAERKSVMALRRASLQPNNTAAAYGTFRQ